MSIELSRKYLEASLEKNEDQIRILCNEQSCEKHFHLGHGPIGQDEIYLSADVFLECVEWIDIQVLNQYESKTIDDAYSYALLELKSSGKFKEENAPFHNLVCQLYKWSHDHKLVSCKDFGEIPWNQKTEDKIKTSEKKHNTDANVDLNGKELFSSMMNKQVDSEFSNLLSTNASISILSHQTEALHNVKPVEFKKRYQELNILNKNLSIKTSFTSGNTSIIESQITGNEESNLPFEMRECFISEWVGNEIVNCRLYSVKVPSLEETMERINKI